MLLIGLITAIVAISGPSDDGTAATIDGGPIAAAPQQADRVANQRPAPQRNPNRRRPAPPPAPRPVPVGRPATPADQQVAWTVVPDPPPPGDRLGPEEDGDGVTITFPPGVSSSSLIVPTPGSPFVAMGSTITPTSALHVFDLRTGAQIGGVTGISTSSKVAFSPNGRCYAAYTFAREGKGLYLVDPVARRMLSTIGMEHQPSHMQFASSGRLVTIRSKEYELWSIPDGRMLQRGDLPYFVSSDESFATSLGGRYLVQFVNDGNDDKLVFVELESGRTVGKIATGENASIQGLAFSPDGSELAALLRIGLGKHELRTWRMRDGHPLGEIPLQAENKMFYRRDGPPIQWFPNGKRWLLRGCMIADRDAKGIVWTVDDKAKSRGPRLVMGDDHVTGTLSGGGTTQLLSVPLPIDEIEAGTTVVAAGGRATDVGLPQATRADWSRVRDLKIAHVPWTVEPDPTPVADVESVTELVPEKRSGDPLVRLLPNGTAVVTHIDRTAGNEKTFVDRYDLKSGKLVHSVTVPFALYLSSVSPSGRLGAFTGMQKGRLDVFSLEDGAHVCGWRPLENEPGRDVPGMLGLVRMLDDEHVLIQRHLSPSVWHVPSCRAVYRYNQAGMTSYQTGPMTPGGRYLTLATRGQLAFVEPRTGRVMGIVSVPSPTRPAFTPDGATGAVLNGGANVSDLLTFDVATGAVRDRLPVRPATSVRWCGPRQVLLDGGRYTKASGLVDLDRGGVIWRYGHIAGSYLPQPPGSRVWYTVRNPSNPDIRVFRSDDLPDPKVAAGVAAVDVESQFVLRPGVSVRLSINISSPPDKPNFTEDVRRRLTERLAANGVHVRDDAPLVIALSTERGSGESKQFRVGPLVDPLNTDSEIVTVQGEHIRCTVELQRNGERLWGTTRVAANTVSTGFLNEGQTVEGIADKNLWNGVTGFFQNVAIPERVFAPEAGYGFGVSRFTNRGPFVMNESPVPQPKQP